MLNLTTQSENQVALEGTLVEITNVRESEKNNNKYIGGTVVIEVTQKVGTEVETSEIPVSFFASQYKKDGGNNPAWDNIQSLFAMNRKSTNPENPDRVRFTSGQITENAYVNKNNGQIVSYWQVRNTFFNKGASGSDDQAAFKAKIVVHSIEDEFDRESNPTGRLKVRGLIVAYGSKIEVVDFIVEDKEAINHIRTYWNPKDTVQVAGYVRALTVTTAGASDESLGFGEAPKIGTTSFKRELVISSGSPGALDEEASYDEAALKQGIAARKEMLDKMVAAAANAPAANPAAQW